MDAFTLACPPTLECTPGRVTGVPPDLLISLVVYECSGLAREREVERAPVQHHVREVIRTVEVVVVHLCPVLGIRLRRSEIEAGSQAMLTTELIDGYALARH